jgi:hypothetical protein
MRLALIISILALFAVACTPGGCQRQESRELFPADSLSREIARSVQVDTLEAVWKSAAGVMRHPRTILFDANGTLFVSDTERHDLTVFPPGGGHHTISSPSFQYPYLAGFVGDTLVVFNPESRHLDFLHDGRVLRSISTPSDIPSHRPLQYAAASDEGLFFKTVGANATGFIARLQPDGSEAGRVDLPGPYWRHAGLLRFWDDSLLSLSGFRPIVDVLSPGGVLDSMALVGFDSPMLARTRNFAMGWSRDAPLITSSAAPAGDYLFVLNMRPGWLHVDVFDRDGHIVRTLTEPNPQPRREYYPLDIAARKTADGFELAVVQTQPEPAVLLFRWRSESK